MEWDENIPTVNDISEWMPQDRRTASLRNAMLLTCQAIQRRIVQEACIERKFNTNNFDSGYGVEDFVRQTLSELLPTRYSVDAGVVNDREGRTAEDCDLLIRNGMWAPAIKLGATLNSRRYFHFAIESIYSAMEIKQTLGFNELDKAMEKLVKISRLSRPIVPYGQVTENQQFEPLNNPGWTINPLHTAIVGTRIPDGIAFSDLAKRFDRINANLGRDDIVHELLVLDRGTAWYDVRTDGDNCDNATYMRDRQQQLIFSMSEQEPANVFYYFFCRLSGHLNRSILRLGDVSAAYGDSTIEGVERNCNATALYNQNL